MPLSVFNLPFIVSASNFFFSSFVGIQNTRSSVLNTSLCFSALFYHDGVETVDILRSIYSLYHYSTNCHFVQSRCLQSDVYKLDDLHLYFLSVYIVAGW